MVRLVSLKLNRPMFYGYIQRVPDSSGTVSSVKRTLGNLLSERQEWPRLQTGSKVGPAGPVRRVPR